MATIRGPVRALCPLGCALLLLSGCDKLNNDGSNWARVALERNDQLSIIAFDENAKTFTVKMKDTGELRVVRVDQVIGSLPGNAPAEAASPPAAVQPPPAASAVSAADTSAASAERKPDEAADTATTGSAVITDPATGAVLATNRDAQHPPSVEAAPANQASQGEDRGDRSLLASGPGYSIKAGDTAPPASIRLASRSSEIPAAARGVALERRSEPMICQGQQMVHIDGRNLEFDGDAISAEDGCDIHITNSHIVAHGVGVSARAANVHIQNSVIQGDSGSVSASEGAQVYTQSSTFRGLSRRLDSAAIHDLGGTIWK